MSRNGAPARSPEEIDKALLCLLVHGGNFTRSARVLKDSGMAHPPSEAALRFWKKTRADRYEELARDYSGVVAERVASEAERLALKLTEAEDAVADRILATVDQIEPRDLSRAIRDLSTSKALQFDKLSNPLRGRPSTIVETHRDGADILRALSLKVPGLVIEGTAEELPLTLPPTMFERPDPPTPEPGKRYRLEDGEWHLAE